MREIRFVDTTLRDGNQSLWDATGLTTAMVLKVAKDMNRAGFKAIDFTSSIHIGVSVKYHKENPFEKIRLAAKAMPDTPLSFGTTGRRFIGFIWSPDAIMELVMRTVAANGIRRVWLIDAAHDIDVISKNAKMAKQAGIEEFVVALSYSISPVHTDDYYLEKTKEIVACPDVDTVYLKDQGGLLTPDRVKTLVPLIQANLEGKPFEIHTHCSSGLGPKVYAEAIRLGVDILHTAIPPLADGTSQPSIFEILDRLGELGCGTRVDGEALKMASEQLYRIAEKEGRKPGEPVDYDPAYYEHQVPGGMVSTLRRQLAEGGMEHRLLEVMEEIKRVRADLGYPIMVTPLSQFVATQASMNVISGKRYKMVPDGVIQYVLGYFGDSPAPVDPQVLDRIHELDKTKKMGLEERPQPTLAELRKTHDIASNVSDEEFLLRYSLKQNEVEEMLAAGPAKTEYP
jgi:oxaloacetate decarboxylase (Na+ extruding) subunit alpha